jgi:hypothetical protein
MYLDAFDRCTLEYLSLLARRGIIDATKIGKNWYMPPKALENCLNEACSRKNRKRKQ